MFCFDNSLHRDRVGYAVSIDLLFFEQSGLREVKFECIDGEILELHEAYDMLVAALATSIVATFILIALIMMVIDEKSKAAAKSRTLFEHPAGESISMSSQRERASSSRFADFEDYHQDTLELRYPPTIE